jgi:hypothetical protein
MKTPTPDFVNAKEFIGMVKDLFAESMNVPVDTLYLYSAFDE